MDRTNEEAGATATVLLTGATGAFGSYLISYILARPHVRLVLLVRGKSDEAARERVVAHTALPDSVEVYAADLTHQHLGLSDERYTDLTSRVTHILHAAANTKFTLPLNEARLHNVVTTEKTLRFALDCTHLVRFAYVSSALVAGRRTGLILEDEFEHNEGFNNTYQQSKYEAEVLVRNELHRLPTVIIRPPLIISKPHATYVGPVNLLSHMIGLIKKRYLPLAPGSRDSTFDMVDGEVTARLTVELALKPTLSHTTYHISNGTRALTVGMILDMLEAHLGWKVPIEFCGDMQAFRWRVFWKSLLRPQLRIVYAKISSYIPEPAYPKIFDNAHLLEELRLTKLEPEAADVFRTVLT